MSKQKLLDRLEALYEGAAGAEHYGEGVTQAQHMFQCAILAEQEDAGTEMIAAALLHDIGHMLSEGDQDDWHRMHDKAGAIFLADYFPASVVEPVRLHVEAKRYNCALDPTYHERLSLASQVTLKLQGGPMSHAECRAFEAEPYFKQALTLRRWDEGGKELNLQTATFGRWWALLEGLVQTA